MNVSVGGKGGIGANGGNVTVMNSGAITTRGEGAYGILAQSVGGGGGAFLAPVTDAEDETETQQASQGIANSFLSALGLQPPVAASSPQDTSAKVGTFTLGGSGSAGGHGGNVSITNSGFIETTGDGATGIFAQSIGGGGGIAEAAVGAGGGNFTFGLGGSRGSEGRGEAVTVTLNPGSSVTTLGDDAIGVLAQSVGGGGGTGGAYQTPGYTVQAGANGATLTATLKSGGGGAGSSGTVVVNVNGAISTSGYLSHGVVAQSIAGGGGYSSVAAGSIQLGQGANGISSAVTVNTTAPIVTQGAMAVGILAQSVAGGGGAGVSSGSITLGGGITRSISGAVTVNVGAPIVTSGASAVGVIAQSVAGGGGVVFSTGTATPIVNGAQSQSGNINVNVNAPILTTGANAVGVVAQTTGGGGGIVIGNNGVQIKGGYTFGSSGTVTVLANASITATGPGGTAIMTKAGNDPIVQIAPGVTVAGGVGGSGVIFDGPSNILTNNGQISDTGGFSVQSLSGTTMVNNGGSMSGSIQLVAGSTNTVHNLAGGTIMAGATVDLGGAGNQFQNDGKLGIAQPGLGATRINGSLMETPSSTLVVRLDTARNQADSFTITGSAQLAGAIQPIETDKGRLRPGTTEQPILQALGGEAVGALTTTEPPSAIEQFVVVPTAGGLDVESVVNFIPAGLDGQDSAIARIVGAIQSNGSSPLFQAITSALANVPTVSALAKAYDAIGGDGISIVPQAKVDAVASAMNVVVSRMDGWMVGDLHSQMPGMDISPVSRDGTDGKRAHVWGTLAASGVSGGGLSGQSYAGTVGVDMEPNGWPVMVGSAVTLSQTANSLAAPSSSNHAADYGVMLYGIGHVGSAYASAIAYGGGGRSSFSRNLSSLGLPLAATAYFSGAAVGGRVEAGYRLDVGETGAHIAPFVAFAPIQIYQGGSTETFAGYGPGLTYRSTTITSLPSHLGVVIDGAWTLPDDTAIAPFLRLAWMHDFKPGRRVPRSFAELPAVGFDTSSVPTVTDAAVIHVGVNYRISRNVQLTASADSLLSGSYQRYGGSAGFKLEW